MSDCFCQSRPEKYGRAHDEGWGGGGGAHLFEKSPVDVLNLIVDDHSFLLDLRYNRAVQHRCPLDHHIGTKFIYSLALGHYSRLARELPQNMDPGVAYRTIIYSRA